MPSSRSSSSIGMPGGYGVRRPDPLRARALRMVHHALSVPAPPPDRSRGSSGGARAADARERPLHARARARCPFRSRKKTYSHGRPRSGRDSILMQVDAVGGERPQHAGEDARPRPCTREHERRLVVAATAARRRAWPRTRKRVRLPALVLDAARGDGEPVGLRRGLGRDRGDAARPGPRSAARRVARHGLERRRAGRCAASQRRHCASACGCATHARGSPWARRRGRRAGSAARGSETSAQIAQRRLDEQVERVASPPPRSSSRPAPRRSRRRRSRPREHLRDRRRAGGSSPRRRTLARREVGEGRLGAEVRDRQPLLEARATPR